MHTIAAKAVALKIAASEPFAERQRQTIANARALAIGLEANGIPVLTGGTDVHLVLVDLTPTGLDGQTAEDRLEAVGITVNRNAIPFDERPPMNPSGLRIGTPALTTRGMKEEEMEEIAAVIATALGPDFESEKASLAERTGALMDRHPLYPQLLAADGLSRVRFAPWQPSRGGSIRCRSGRPRCVPGVSRRPGQAVAATRRPGREASAGNWRRDRAVPGQHGTKSLDVTEVRSEVGVP